MNTIQRLCLLTGAALSAALFIIGCESGSDKSSDSFKIEPAAHNLTLEEATLTLKAVGGKEPLTWKISDTTLGTLTGTNNARNVTYTRNTKEGTQTIEVSDANTWTANALIHQISTITPVTISPTAVTLTSDGDKTVFTAAEGVPPYAWTVGIAARGSVAVDGFSQATYTRQAESNNTVIVTDKQGHAAITEISQPGTATLTVSPVTATVNIRQSLVFSAIGGVSPYTWAFQNAPGSGGGRSINPAIGNQTAYTAGGLINTTDIIQLTDANGTIAFATVTVP